MCFSLVAVCLDPEADQRYQKFTNFFRHKLSVAKKFYDKLLKEHLAIAQIETKKKGHGFLDLLAGVPFLLHAHSNGEGGDGKRARDRERQRDMEERKKKKTREKTEIYVVAMPLEIGALQLHPGGPAPEDVSGAPHVPSLFHLLGGSRAVLAPPRLVPSASVV